MNHMQASGRAADATRTAAPATDECVRRQGRSRPLDGDGQRLYQVLLSGDDLRLIQACSRWICRLGPAPDVCARFVHLQQQLARAQPVPPTSRPGQGPAAA